MPMITERLASGSGRMNRRLSPRPPSPHLLRVFGTEGQVRTCSRCGKVNPEYAEFCSRCGTALKPPEWGNGQYNAAPNQNQYGGRPFNGGYGEYTPFHMPVMDQFGGVPHDEKIEDISAEDMVAFVGSNSSYYLPRFSRMSRNGSFASWNWAAFLFTPYWLLYRKNYLSGGIVLFLSLADTFINSFVLGRYIQPHLDMSSDTAMFNSLYSLIQGGRFTLYFSIITLLFIISLFIRILFGLTGNWIYKHTAVKRIHRIQDNNNVNGYIQDSAALSDYRRELSIQGGVSLILVAVASGIAWFGQMLFQAMLLNL